MLRLNSLSQVHKRRLLRPLLAHTQATPVPYELSSSFVRTGGALTGTATTGITGNTAGAILPGFVAVKAAGRTVTAQYSASSGADTETPVGLFGQYVGGDMDDLHGASEVAVWSGPGSHWELLAPAFDDTGLSALAAAEDGTDENEVYMKANAKAQLVGTAASPGQAFGQCARLIERLSANAITVQLLV